METGGSGRGVESRMVTMIVRLAASTDIDPILRMDSSTPIDQSRRARVHSAVDRSECFVASMNGVLAGYGAIDYGFFGRGFVSLVYVDAAHRRRGVGSRLFDEFERRCTSSRIFTSTNLSNLPMQTFLVSRRYVLSGVVHHLDEGDPEMFYSKQLR
jgi:GNAT superfamily N-acetyltransferase